MAAGGGRAFAWQVFPPMPTCRVYGTVAHQDGHLLVLGGCGRAGLPLDTAETLDMASHTWLALAPLPTARAGAAAVVLGKQVLVVGGVDEAQSPVAAVEAFLADEGRWERRATLPQAAMGVATVERGEWLREGPSGAPTVFIFSLFPQRLERHCLGHGFVSCLLPYLGFLQFAVHCLFWAMRWGVRAQETPRKIGDPSHYPVLVFVTKRQWGVWPNDSHGYK